MPLFATSLGRAGLLPFCAGPVLLYADPVHRALYADGLASYALAIVCFLVGIWWGLSLIRRAPWALLASNLIVLVAFFAFMALPKREFFLLCAALFPVIVLVERRGRLFRAQPLYYAQLRLQLSAVATVAHLLAATLV